MVYYRLEGSVKVLEQLAADFSYVHKVTEGSDVFYYAVDISRAVGGQLRSREIETTSVSRSTADIRRLLNHFKRMSGV